MALGQGSALKLLRLKISEWSEQRAKPGLSPKPIWLPVPCHFYNTPAASATRSALLKASSKYFPIMTCPGILLDEHISSPQGLCQSKDFFSAHVGRYSPFKSFQERGGGIYIKYSLDPVKITLGLEDSVHVSNLLSLRCYSGWSSDEQEVSKERIIHFRFALLLNDVQKKLLCVIGV